MLSGLAYPFFEIALKTIEPLLNDLINFACSFQIGCLQPLSHKSSCRLNNQQLAPTSKDRRSIEFGGGIFGFFADWSSKLVVMRLKPAVVATSQPHQRLRFLAAWRSATGPP